MIAGTLNDSDLAAVASTSGASSGLTRDRAKLQDAIMKLKVQILYRNNEQGARVSITTRRIGLWSFTIPWHLMMLPRLHMPAVSAHRTLPKD